MANGSVRQNRILLQILGEDRPRNNTVLETTRASKESQVDQLLSDMAALGQLLPVNYAVLLAIVSDGVSGSGVHLVGVWWCRFQV